MPGSAGITVFSEVTLQPKKIDTKAKAEVLEKSSFTNLVYFPTVKKIFLLVPFSIVIGSLLAVCVSVYAPQIYTKIKTKRANAIQFSSNAKCDTVHPEVSSLGLCVGRGSFFFAIPLLLVLRIVSEDSNAFPLDTSCMGFSGALLERGSFFISFFISCEDREKENKIVV